MSGVDIVTWDLWDDASLEGVVLVWIYADGASVTTGEVLAEVTVEKAQLEVLSPASGRLTILAVAETIIRRGDVIGRIDTT